MSSDSELGVSYNGPSRYQNHQTPKVRQSAGQNQSPEGSTAAKVTSFWAPGKPKIQLKIITDDDPIDFELKGESPRSDLRPGVTTWESSRGQGQRSTPIRDPNAEGRDLLDFYQNFSDLDFVDDDVVEGNYFEEGEHLNGNFGANRGIGKKSYSPKLSRKELEMLRKRERFEPIGPITFGPICDSPLLPLPLGGNFFKTFNSFRNE